MKNYLWRNTSFTRIFFILFFTVFIFPNLVNATSGSCSYHNGVACSLGSDYDGSVICNDGWRDSSVSFYNADECKVSTFSCPLPSGIKSDCGSIRAQNARSGLLGSSFGENELAQCEAQNREYDLSQEAYQKCLDSQTEIREQRLNDSYIYNKTQDQNIDREIQEKFDNYCVSSQGAGSVWINGVCKPTTSDFIKSCQEKMGSGAIYEKALGICVCPGEYRIDSNNQCVINQSNIEAQGFSKIQDLKNNLLEKITEDKKSDVKLKIDHKILEEPTTTKQDIIDTSLDTQQPTENKGWFKSLFKNIGSFFSNLFN